jgi:rhodanese-related sulfurtransferase
MSPSLRRAFWIATWLTSLGFWSAACGVDAGSAPDASAEISQKEVLASIGTQQAPLLLDVRTPEEYASGHVPGARNLPIDQLPARSGELAAYRDQPVVVYCERGPRGAKAAEDLTAAGFTSVRSLAGHMSAWREAGLPTE